jgi:hypothetical protein
MMKIMLLMTMMMMKRRNNISNEKFAKCESVISTFYLAVYIKKTPWL